MPFSETPVERALIARGAKTATILATDGATIALEMDAIGTDCADDVLGDWFTPTSPGLYLFVGKGKWESSMTLDSPSEPELQWAGTVQDVNPDQMQELLTMHPKEEESVCLLLDHDALKVRIDVAILAEREACAVAAERAVRNFNSDSIVPYRSTLSNVVGKAIRNRSKE